MKYLSKWCLLVFVLLIVVSCTTKEEESAAAPSYVLDPDTQITLVEGFDAELLYTVPESQGSWVAMDFDSKGRLLVSDQDDKGVFRLTLASEGDADGRIQVESLTGFPFEPVAWGRRTVAGALGFLYAFDSLYMSTMKGFYRIRDTDGDDSFDEFTLLKKLHPGWEHSAHTQSFGTGADSIVCSKIPRARSSPSSTVHARIFDAFTMMLSPRSSLTG